MKTKTKSIIIHSPPEKVFRQMDDFSKTGMHMTQSSMMMMGSKLKLEQLSSHSSGLGTKYRWYGNMMGMTIDFTDAVTKWQPPMLKEWETIGDAKIIIMSWYRMWFEISPNEKGSLVKLSISYLPPKDWFYRILSFLFAHWYCNWCLNNMLLDTRNNLERASNSGQRWKPCLLMRTMGMPDMVHDVKTNMLIKNDIILVKPGEKVAADEIVLEGEVI